MRSFVRLRGKSPKNVLPLLRLFLSILQPSTGMYGMCREYGNRRSCIKKDEIHAQNTRGVVESLPRSCLCYRRSLACGARMRADAVGRDAPRCVHISQRRRKSMQQHCPNVAVVPFCRCRLIAPPLFRKVLPSFFFSLSADMTNVATPRGGRG